MTARASQPSLHVAGFYETESFLAQRVASFITEGLTNGEQVIVLATASHWTAVSARLNESGLAFARAVTEGRLLLKGMGQQEIRGQQSHLVSDSGERVTLH